MTFGKEREKDGIMNTKSPLGVKKKHNKALIKVIALAVTIAFLCQNVVWANPNSFTNGERRVTNKKLAPKSQVKKVYEAYERQKKQNELKGTPKEEKEARELKEQSELAKVKPSKFKRSRPEEKRIERIKKEYEQRFYPMTETRFDDLPKETREILICVGISDDFVKLIRVSGKSAGYILESGLPAIKKAFGIRFVKKYWKNIVSQLTRLCSSTTSDNLEDILNLLLDETYLLILKKKKADFFMHFKFYNTVIQESGHFPFPRSALEGVVAGVRENDVNVSLDSEEQRLILDFIAVSYNFFPKNFIFYKEKKEIEDSIKQYPLADGHVHFSGSIPPHFLWKKLLELDEKEIESIDWKDINTKLTRIYKKEVDLKAIVDEGKRIFRDKTDREGKKISTEEVEKRLQELRRIFTGFIQYDPSKGEGNLGDYIDLYSVAKNLVEGLSENNPEFIREMATGIAMKGYEDGLRLLELRTSLPTDEDEVELYRRIFEKLNYIKEGLQDAERDVNSRLGENEIGLETKIVITLEKNKETETSLTQTKVLLKILEDHPQLREYVVGVDVANKEQLKVPTQFIEHFELIEEYNKRLGIEGEPKLGLTYHVGEDFSDTSIESAIRHVHDAINLGIGRIGHGLVLGIDVEQFRGKESEEHLSERIFQIYYDLKCVRFDAIGLKRVGLDIKTDKLKKELQGYSKKYEDVRAVADQINLILDNNELDKEKEKQLFAAFHEMRDSDEYAPVTIKYNSKRCWELIKRQNYVLNKVIEKVVAIEFNPTSNVLIGPIRSYAEHPIGRIIDYMYPTTEFRNGLAGQRPIVTINTDSPGTFGINIVEEYKRIVVALKLSKQDILRLIINSFKYRFSGYPLRYFEAIERKLDTQIEKKFEGYQIAQTQFGNVQLAIASETAKNIIKMRKEKKTFPTTFILPPDILVGGYNYADIEFVMYFFAFVVGKGLKINLVLTVKQEIALREYLKQSMFGIDFKSSDWKKYRKKWIKNLAKARGREAEDPAVSEEIKVIEKGIQAAHEALAVRNLDGTPKTIDDYINFYPLKEGKAWVTMMDVENPEIPLGQLEIKQRKNKPEFVIKDFARAKEVDGEYVFIRIRNPVTAGLEVDYTRPCVLPEKIPFEARKAVSAKNRPRFGYTVLARNNGFDGKGEVSSFIIWVEGKGILVDPSLSAVKKLEQLGLTKDDVPYVILTHNHADHDRGLLKWLFAGKKVKFLTSHPVYFSFLKKAKALLKEDIDGEYADFIPLLDNMENEILLPSGEKMIIQIRLNLHPIPTIGLKFNYEHEGQVYRIGFSGDHLFSTDENEKIKEYIQNMKDLGLSEEQISSIMHNLWYFFWDESGELLVDALLQEAGSEKEGLYSIHTTSDTLKEVLTEDTIEKIALYHKAEGKFPVEGFNDVKSGETVTVLPSDEQLLKDYRMQMVSLVSLFSDMNKEDVAWILEEGTDRNYNQDDVLIKQGTSIEEIIRDPEKGVFYIILEGDVVVEKKDGQFVTRIGKGACVGEWALISGQPRAANIKAGDGLKVLELTISQFEALIKKYPKLEERIFKGREHLPFLQKLRRSYQENNPFKELGGNVLMDLACKVEPISIKDGTKIIKQGEKGDDLYLIKSGSVSVFIKKRGEIDILSEGGFFGEIAMLSKKGIRTATVVAHGDVELFRISRNQFDKILKNWPDFGREMKQAARERMERSGESLKSLIVPVVIKGATEELLTPQRKELHIEPKGVVEIESAA